MVVHQSRRLSLHNFSVCVSAEIGRLQCQGNGSRACVTRECACVSVCVSCECVCVTVQEQIQETSIEGSNTGARKNFAINIHVIH